MFPNDRNEVTCMHCSFVCCQQAIENFLNTLTRHCCGIGIFRVFFLLALSGPELELLAILDVNSCIIFRCSLSRVSITSLKCIFSAITFSSHFQYWSSILLIEKVRNEVTARNSTFSQRHSHLQHSPGKGCATPLEITEKAYRGSSRRKRSF